MKTLAFTLCGLFLLCGCSEKFQTKTMEWDTSNLLYTNQNLVIYASSGPIQTNVDSLDQAANILGQYGWEFVNSDTEGDKQVYHMKRQARKECDFFLIPNIIPYDDLMKNATNR